MVRLTSNTRLNKHGDEVDASLYLVRFDSRNLAIIEGAVTTDARGAKKQNVLAYFGDVKTALVRSVDIAIKHGGECTELSDMVQRIDNLAQHIETACDAHNIPSMMQLLKSGES